MIHRTTWACALLLVAAACGGDAAKTTSSSTPPGSAAPKTGDAKPADAAAAKGPPTKLERKVVEPMLDELFGFKRMKEPIDKRVAEAESKLGPPAKTDNGDGVWYVKDDAGGCSSLKLGKKDGAYTLTTVDKPLCGL
jgi:hypothetical protein